MLLFCLFIVIIAIINLITLIYKNMKIQSIQPKYTPTGVGYVVIYEDNIQQFFNSLEELKKGVL